MDRLGTFTDSPRKEVPPPSPSPPERMSEKMETRFFMGQRAIKVSAKYEVISRPLPLLAHRSEGVERERDRLSHSLLQTQTIVWDVGGGCSEE